MKKRMKCSIGLLALTCSGLLLAMSPVCVSAKSSVRESIKRGLDSRENLVSSELSLPDIIFEERVDRRQRRDVRVYTFTGDAEESFVFYWEHSPEDVSYGINIELTGPDGEVVPIVSNPASLNSDGSLLESEGKYYGFALPKAGAYELRFSTQESGQFSDDVLPEASEHLFRLRRASDSEHLIILANSLFESGQFERAVSTYELAIQEGSHRYEAYFSQIYAYGQMLLASPAHAEEIAAIQRTTAQKLDAVSSDGEGVLILEAVRQAFGLLGPEEQKIVIRNFRELDRHLSELDSEALATNSSHLRFYADSLALLETGVTSDYLVENYDFLYYFFLDRRYD